MLLENALKQGQTRRISIDIGQGTNVGVTFQSTNPSLLFVSNKGTVRAELNPAQPTTAWVKVFDVSNRLRAVFQYDVVPSSVDLTGILDASTGQPLRTTQLSVGRPLSPEAAVVDSAVLSVGVASQIVVSGLNKLLNYTLGTVSGESLAALAMATSNASGVATFTLTPVNASPILAGVYRSEDATEALAPQSFPVQ